MLSKYTKHMGLDGQISLIFQTMKVQYRSCEASEQHYYGYVWFCCARL